MFGFKNKKIELNEMLNTVDVLKRVFEAYPTRSFENISRRILKLGEENGELAEAYLYATSANNIKEKVMEDIREEAIDAMIVSACVSCTPLPGETPEQALENARAMFDKKMNKWVKKLGEGVTGISGLTEASEPLKDDDQR